MSALRRAKKHLPASSGVKFWIDEQLPPATCLWLAESHAVEAATLEMLGLLSSPDDAIFTLLRQPGNVIVTKDDDFIDLVGRLGPPPQVLWVTCGNVTNRALRELFAAAFPVALELLRSGEPIVEVRRK
jgi:predicted nuclease of predicted toxin-antitoxin system